MLRKSLFLSFLLSISVRTEAQQNPNYRILPYTVNPVQYERSPPISQKQQHHQQQQQPDGFDLKQVNLDIFIKAVHTFTKSTVLGNTQGVCGKFSRN